MTRRYATHYPPDARHFEPISGSHAAVTDGASREYQRNFSDHDHGKVVEIAQKDDQMRDLVHMPMRAAALCCRPVGQEMQE